MLASKTMLRTNGLMFLQPTPELRELILLSEIATDPRITQERLAVRAGIGAPMANGYLKQFVRRGLMRKGNGNNRNMTYHLTDSGEVRRKELLRQLMNETVGLYKRGKEEFADQIEHLKKAGLDRVVLYGAGDTGDIVLAVAERSNLEVLAVVDSDRSKQGTLFHGRRVLDPSRILSLKPQAVLITSLGYAPEIAASLKDIEAAGIRVLSVRD